MDMWGFPNTYTLGEHGLAAIAASAAATAVAVALAEAEALAAAAATAAGETAAAAQAAALTCEIQAGDIDAEGHSSLATKEGGIPDRELETDCNISHGARVLVICASAKILWCCCRQEPH